MAPIDLFAMPHTAFNQVTSDQFLRYFFRHGQPLLWVLCHEFGDLPAERLAQRHGCSFRVCRGSVRIAGTAVGMKSGLLEVPSLFYLEIVRRQGSDPTVFDGAAHSEVVKTLPLA